MGTDRDEEQRITELVWPDGIPDRERIVLEGLTPERKAQALRRLEAVWRAERGENWRPLASGIGLGKAAFYNLRSAWRQRSLEGVIPFASRAPRRIRTDPGASIRKRARELILAAGMADRNVDIARALLDADPENADIGGTSDQTRLQWAVRLIRHERAALATDPDFLSANFGRRIAVDLSAASVVLKGEAELAVVAVCIDTASRLIIGSGLGRLTTALELQRSALEDARLFLSRHCADRAPSIWPKCDLDLMLPPGLDGLKEQELLQSVTTILDVRVPGTYAYGQEIVQLIGPRIGRLPVAPRKTLAVQYETIGTSRTVVELLPKDARAFWEREVLRHNTPIMAALSKAGLTGIGVKHGRIADVLEALDAALLASVAT